MGLITTLVVSFLVCCMLEVRCGLAGVVSGLQAKAQSCFGCSPTLKGKAIPIQAWTGPRVFQEIETPRLQDNQHVNIEGLSVLQTGRLYPSENIPDTHFC